MIHVVNNLFFIHLKGPPGNPGAAGSPGRVGNAVSIQGLTQFT